MQVRDHISQPSSTVKAMTLEEAYSLQGVELQEFLVPLRVGVSILHAEIGIQGRLNLRYKARMLVVIPLKETDSVDGVELEVTCWVAQTVDVYILISADLGVMVE